VPFIGNGKVANLFPKYREAIGVLSVAGLGGVTDGTKQREGRLIMGDLAVVGVVGICVLGCIGATILSKWKS
jgi:hypothetical protein